MRTDGPLDLAFLGDPNSVHVRRWLGCFSDRGHRMTMLVPDGKVVVPGMPPAISVERLPPFATGERLLDGRGGDGRARLLRRESRSRRPARPLRHGNAWHAWISGFHPYVVTVWGSDILATGHRGPRVASTPGSRCTPPTS